MDKVYDERLVSLGEFRRHWKEKGHDIPYDDAYHMARAITFCAFFTPKLYPERKPLVSFRIDGKWQPHPDPGKIFYDEFTEYIAWVIRKVRQKECEALEGMVPREEYDRMHDLSMSRQEELGKLDKELANARAKLEKAEQAGYQKGWMEGHEKGAKEGFQDLVDEGRVRE